VRAKLARRRVAVAAGAAAVLLAGPALPFARAAEAVVLIDHRAYNPDPVAVHVGDTVTWKNGSDEDHNVRGGPFNSPALHPGNTFSFTFTKVGTVSYVCDFHPTMKGTIKVA
jgi:plastocyanin